MGGNIFENTIRLNSKDYLMTTKEIFILLNKVYDTQLSNIVFSNCIREIPAYKTKSSFGDMDILINSTYLDKSIMIKYLQSQNIPYSNNGDVLSFRYVFDVDKPFQIDLIYTKDEYFMSSYHYFSWNDLGNLMGVLIKKLGLKYGHKGLSLVIRDKEYVMSEIQLSTNVEDALNILGLSIEQFYKGFNTLENIFEFIISSKYFNSSAYLLDNRSNISRVRDRKRKTYNSFLNYLKDNNIQPKHIFKIEDNKGGYNIKEPYYTEIVLKYFPWVEQEVQKLNAIRESQKLFRQVFVPELVIELTKLSGKELGAFFSWVRNNIVVEYMEDIELQKRLIIQVFNQYTHNN